MAPAGLVEIKRHARGSSGGTCRINEQPQQHLPSVSQRDESVYS